MVEIISQVVEDLVRGEFMQLGTKTDETLRFNHYLEKTYRYQVAQGQYVVCNTGCLALHDSKLRSKNFILSY